MPPLFGVGGLLFSLNEVGIVSLGEWRHPPYGEFPEVQGLDL